MAPTAQRSPDWMVEELLVRTLKFQEPAVPERARSSKFSNIPLQRCFSTSSDTPSEAVS